MRNPPRSSWARWLTALALATALLGVAPASTIPAGGRLHASASVQTLVLQPDGTNGTDTFVHSLAPLWNYGDNASLNVGPNATTGGLVRSLLSFNLAAIPSNATIVNASLNLYESQGSQGLVQVHPLLANWTEGSGGRSWTVVPVQVRETGGVNRTREPVGLTVPFQPGAISEPVRDLRVYDRGVEVPSQVYGFTFSGGVITSARVFFDASVDAFQTKTFDIEYSTNGTTVPAYRTRTWSAGSIWSYTSTGGGASGATIADIDHDGRLEIVFGGTDGYLYCLYDNGLLKWRTLVSPGQSVPFTPQAADMDRSGKMSIVALTNTPGVVRVNSTGNVVWWYNSSSVLWTVPTLVDVNGDGVKDVLVGGNMKQITVINGKDGTLLPPYPVSLAGYTATIADIDGSGQPEIVFGGDDKAVHAVHLDGSQLWTRAPPGVSFLEGSIAFGDVNGDGFPEVVTGDNGNNGIEFALWASNGTTVWSSPLPSYREGGQTLADLDGAGKLETLVGLSSGAFYALRGTDGTVLWSYPAGTVQAGTPVVANLDRGSSPEILFIEGNTVYVLGPSGLLVHSWSIIPPNLNLRSSTQYPMTAPAVADLTGNGTLEILVPTATGMEAFMAPGLDHDWRTWGYNNNHTQRALDGNSLEGAPFLRTTLGAPAVHPAKGVSWNYRDGTNAWTAPGGSFGPAAATATAAVGWMSWNITGLVQDWVSATSPNDGLAVMEGNEVTGFAHTFVAYDSPLAAQRPRLAVTYVLGATGSVTYPPQILGPIPDVSRPENSAPFTMDLSAYAYDNSTALSQLRWNVTGYDTRVLQITGLNTLGNHVVNVYPQPQVFGAFRVTYWLTDPQGRFAQARAWINITYTNQPPSFSPPPTLFVHYNLTYAFDFGPYIYDPDTPRALVSLRVNDTVHAAVAGFNVSFTYGYAYLNQWAFVNLTVSDGEFNVSRIVAVKVTSDNPPVLRVPIPDQVLWEGQVLVDAFNLHDYFTDPNNDSLYYSIGYTHIYVTIRANGSVDLGAIANWWGQDYVTFRATDPTGALAEDTIRVTVLHLDRPPSIGAVPDLRVRYDSPYSFDLEPYLSDPDTPVALLNVSTSDVHVTVSGHLLTFFYTGAYNNTVQNVTLSVSDGTYAVSRTIRVAVGSDWPPALRAKMPDTTFQEGTTVSGAYNLSRYFSDPDSNLLYWSAGNQKVLIAIHANGSVDLSARPYWHGTERVTFRATDGQGALAEDSVWITVTPINYAPFFRPVPHQTLNVTTTYLPLTSYLGDPDDNVSTLFLAGTNSTHAAILGQGILLRYAQDMTEFVRVVVSDGNLTNTTTIVVTVSLPRPTTTIVQEIPGFVYWIPVPVAIATLAAFLVYRYRKLEWAFLVTKDGLLVCSICRQSESTMDTDLLTGMLTAIMDFANKSFSEEGEERNLEGLELGEKRVAIVRGELSFLAVVYRGRTPGSLIWIMRTLLNKIEAEHRDALGTIVDTSKLGEIPVLLQRLVSRGNLPFVSFGGTKQPAGARSNGL